MEPGLPPRSARTLHVNSRDCDRTVRSEEHCVEAYGGHHESSVAASSNAGFGPNPAQLLPIYKSEEIAFV
jgi:hypothetical protein